MDISNPVYGLVLTVFSLTAAGITTYLSYRYFRKKGKSREYAAGRSIAIGGVVEVILIWIGIQGPALVLIPLVLFAIAYALLYSRAFYYLRRKIHGDEVDK